MIAPDDPRVEHLQKEAWGLQSLTSKPGSRLPEDFKRDVYRLGSRAVALCTDIAYTEEKDFEERSKLFLEQIAAKKKECEKVEEAEKEKLVGKCFRIESGGNYTVKKVTDRSKQVQEDTVLNAGRSLTSTAGGARALTASEVAARCAEDPGDLSLCGMGLGDSDMEPICKGLKQAGAALTTLDLSHNLLADVGIQKLVSALASGTCPKLQELHVSHNSFGDLGAQMLQGGLAKLRRGLVVHVDAGDPREANEQSRTEAGEHCAGGALLASNDACKPEESADGLEVAITDSIHIDAGVSKKDGSISEMQPATKDNVEKSSTAQGEDIKFEIVKSNDLKDLQVRVLLALPDSVTSASDIDVDISTWRIVARTSSGVIFDSQLPCGVVADSAQAVFSRKRRTMTLTLHPSDLVAAAALHK
jgi:hypothetical protein